jgi:hypothetical protein
MSKNEDYKMFWCLKLKKEFRYFNEDCYLRDRSHHRAVTTSMLKYYNIRQWGSRDELYRYYYLQVRRKVDMTRWVPTRMLIKKYRRLARIK